MSHYKIITDEAKLDAFIATLPELEEHEVWYLALFGRHKYDPSFPNTRDSGQLTRITARNKVEFKEKIRRMEVPLGSYSRDGAVASQQCLAAYMAMNPRSLIKANKAMLIELATRIANGETCFNPVSVSTTCIHKAVDRKFFVDFDFDGVTLGLWVDEHMATIPASVITTVLPDPAMYRILRTRGGFHLLVDLSKIKELKTKWHQAISALPGCDVRGSNTLTPIPGCTQGGFTPHFTENL